MFGEKMWGSEPFWGLGAEWDPQWLLTDSQKKLQADLIELCRTTLRENAVESDKKLLFPRKNFQAMAKLGLLGLIAPKELGGMGENHVCAAMAVETIARYGCASHRHVLHHAPGRRRRRGPALPRQQAPARHPLAPGPGLPGRHALLLRPGDRRPFLVPDVVRRGADRGRLEGQEEGVLDHLGRIRGLVHRPDHQPRLRRQLLQPVLLSDHGRRGQCRSRRTGTVSACAATNRDRWRSRTGWCRSTDWSGRSATAPRPTTSASTRSS